MGLRFGESGLDRVAPPKQKGSSFKSGARGKASYPQVQDLLVGSQEEGEIL